MSSYFNRLWLGRSIPDWRTREPESARHALAGIKRGRRGRLSMAHEDALRKIQEAARLGKTALSIRGTGLTVLPPEIGQLTGLEGLYLSGTGLTMLPPEIGQLTGLQMLDLSDTGLTALPPEIGQLTGLRELYLSGTGLTMLPLEIGQLTGLQVLNLSRTELTMLPPEIGQLTGLQELYLRGTGLTMLPPEIGQLTGLQVLYLSGTGLTMLPPEIGQLTSLRELYLTNTKLTMLPLEIGQLTGLRLLNLSVTGLTALPPEIGRLTGLQGLYLRGTGLPALPPEIGRLIKLIELDLRDTQLPIPPEILERVNEPAVIVNYYFQHQAGLRKPMNEAKVLLVGQGSVGKTSLVRRLVEGRFDPRENKTEGIDIRRWQVAVDGQAISLNVWDFGGQEILHATHQFFLTRRSLYLLVLDARLTEEENRLEYWLKIIQSFGGGSPVVLVGNKIDQHPLDLDRRGLQAKYPAIKAIVKTSCETGAGLKELHAAIAREVAALDHIHDQLLLSWFAVKRRLERMEEDYILYTEYVRMCQAEGVADDLSQRTLIGFLHDLGVVLNFQDDPRLEDTNILNPEWVTTGVYRILNSNALFQSKGALDRAMLDRILDRPEYPRNKHLFIIDMMRKFELCFDFEGFADRKFLIPDLLSKEEPYTGEWGDALAFQCHYNVLPGSVISRFIVRMNHCIHQSTYWRTGVVLASGATKALVKADIEDRKVYIWVGGPERGRREFLAAIRNEFDAIHRTIPGIKAVEKVPVPGQPEVVVDYKHLLTLEGKGIASFIPEGMQEEVDVGQLLSGVRTEKERGERQGGRMPDDKADSIQVGDMNHVTGAAIGAGAQTTVNLQIESVEHLELPGTPSRPAAPVATAAKSDSSPWLSGSFYLVALVAIVVLFAVISNYVAWYVLPIVIIGGLLAVGIVGALQLRQDERLSQANFLTLMIESFKRLPLLRGGGDLSQAKKLPQARKR
jgi:internalin A